MNLIKSCVLFINATTNTTHSIPPHVEELLKNRLMTQYSSQYHNLGIHFDKGECPSQGTYELAQEEITLNANGLQWPRKSDFKYSAILDGIRLEFPKPLIEYTTLPIENRIAQKPQELKKNHWVATSVVGAVLLVTALAILNKKSKPTMQQQEHVPQKVEEKPSVQKTESHTPIQNAPQSEPGQVPIRAIEF